MSIAFVSGGATCPKRGTLRDEFRPPVVWTETPTLQQVADHVNRSLAIDQLASNNLSVTSPDYSGKLTGNFQWERPHKFTFEAYIMKALGVNLAAGSNEQMFWLQSSSPPTVYFARHDEFESQPGTRYVLPVSPLWLREALGVIEFDPAGQHEEPTVRADGKVEVVSYIPSPGKVELVSHNPSPRGAYRRVLTLSPTLGTIEQTRLYDVTGKLVAMAQQSDHEYFSDIDWSLPHNVIVQLYPDEGPALSFTIDVGFYLRNQPPNTDPDAYNPPDPTGLSTVNLVQYNQSQAAVQPTPPTYTPTEPTGSQSSLINYRTVR